MATTVDNEPATKKMKTSSTSTEVEHAPSPGEFALSERFLRLLIRTNVDVVRPPENKIFVAQRTDKVIDVWKGLVTHNFLSVPVMQKTKNKYYGFVDIFDIVRFVLEFFGESDQIKNTEDWMKLALSSEEFCEKTVNDIMRRPLTARNPFFPIHTGFSLFSAVEALAKERGLHRVPVINPDRTLVTVITQYQLIQILFRNLDILGDKKKMPINRMSRYIEDVISINENAPAIEAFRLMIDKNIGGLAVIDSEGKLTANISLRDLKAMSTDARLFWRLFQPIHSFLLKVRGENIAQGGDRPRTVITVKQDDNLETVIRRLSEHKIHRIYVVDEQKKPIGVLTLKDVLYEIIS